MNAEKQAAAHHLINLFPEMTLDEAMELSLKDIQTRVKNKTAEIEAAYPQTKAPSFEPDYTPIIEQIENIIEFLKDKENTLPAIQNLSDAINNLRRI
jgi:CO dehydrogenase/acetyl-CoA synthase delta subunit